jgi:hypothetical protein
MNLYQIFNNTATFFIYAALVGGAVKALSDEELDVWSLFTIHLDGLLLFLFIALFNIKSTLDDYKYFGESFIKDEVWERNIGLVLAIFHWLFMALAAALVYDPKRCAELLFVSLVFSTIWICFHLIEIWHYKERPKSQKLISLMRQKWFFINIVYLMLLSLYFLNIGKDYMLYVYTSTLFLTLIIDVATSDTFKDIFTNE